MPQGAKGTVGRSGALGYLGLPPEALRPLPLPLAYSAPPARGEGPTSVRGGKGLRAARGRTSAHSSANFPYKRGNCFFLTPLVPPQGRAKGEAERGGAKGGKEKRFWDYSSFIPSSMSFLLTVGFLKVGNQPITGNDMRRRRG